MVCNTARAQQTGGAADFSGNSGSGRALLVHQWESAEGMASHRFDPNGPSFEQPIPAARQDGASKVLKALLCKNSFRTPLNLTEDHILSVILVRRARESILGGNLFSDPAWDILLELYAARLACRRMSVADLARAIETPAGTTERWIAALEHQGLTRCYGDRTKPARTWISLTPDGASKMERLADHWGSAFVSI